jgi:hypothetical protein
LGLESWKSIIAVAHATRSRETEDDPWKAMPCLCDALGHVQSILERRYSTVYR